MYSDKYIAYLRKQCLQSHVQSVRERDKEIDQNRNRPTDQPNRGANKKK